MHFLFGMIIKKNIKIRIVLKIAATKNVIKKRKKMSRVLLYSHIIKEEKNKQMLN